MKDQVVIIAVIAQNRKTDNVIVVNSVVTLDQIAAKGWKAARSAS